MTTAFVMSCWWMMLFIGVVPVFVLGLKAKCMSVGFCSKGNKRLFQNGSITLPVPSRLHCLSKCSLDGCCVAVNYRASHFSCEILQYGGDVGQITQDNMTELITTECESAITGSGGCTDHYQHRGHFGFRVYDGQDIDGHDDFKKMDSSLAECQRLCLESTDFFCRSVDFRSDLNNTCYLSTITEDSMNMRQGHEYLHAERNCYR